MFSWNRVGALMRQDFYIARRDLAVWSDLFFFSIMNILVFGLIAQYFSHGNREASLFVLSGMLLWEVIRLAQYCFNITTMMNVWSSNLSNLFIAPISRMEFVVANMLVAAIKTVGLFLIVSVASIVFFDFNIFTVGFPLLLAGGALFLAGISLGLVLMGLVFRFGVRIQALTWSTIALFQPLLGVYFPLDVLPRPFQWLAEAIPATHAFAGIRNVISGEGDVYPPLFFAIGAGLALFGFAYWTFARFHKKSMLTGQFARNDN